MTQLLRFTLRSALLLTLLANSAQAAPAGQQAENTLPEACEVYLNSTLVCANQISTSEKEAQRMADQILEASISWRQVPPNEREAMRQFCVSALHAFRQSAAVMSCALPPNPQYDQPATGNE